MRNAKGPFCVLDSLSMPCSPTLHTLPTCSMSHVADLICMHMWGSAPAQDYLIFSALWAYSYHQIWKKSQLLVWRFSIMAVWNANVWSPCMTSEFSSLSFSNHSLPSLMCNITYTQVVWYSVEMSWRPLCTFLEVFFAWLPDPELIYHAYSICLNLFKDRFPYTALLCVPFS